MYFRSWIKSLEKKFVSMIYQGVPNRGSSGMSKSDLIFNRFFSICDLDHNISRKTISLHLLENICHQSCGSSR
jgi:hypothetical protein